METECKNLLPYHKAAISAQLVSLRARYEAASGYVMNSDMQIESNLLRQQIDALRVEMTVILESEATTYDE